MSHQRQGEGEEGEDEKEEEEQDEDEEEEEEEEERKKKIISNIRLQRFCNTVMSKSDFYHISLPSRLLSRFGTILSLSYTLLSSLSIRYFSEVIC